MASANMTRHKTSSRKPSPLDRDAARAEREGDFARARALSAQLCHAAGSGAGAIASEGAAHRGAGVGQQETLAAAQDRLRRLGTDPVAWRVGAAALAAYIAAWFYALGANT